MTAIPDQVLIHTVTVEPRTGTSSTGPVYGEPYTLRCMRQGGMRLVRDANGDERTSSTTLYCAPLQSSAVPAGSRVTLDNGARTTVMASIDHDSGHLGAPDHTEVVCE